MILRVKSWGEFQHYKGRRPPWIKLHRALLDDYDWHRLPDASKALAPMLWLLASESEDGRIVLTEAEISFRLRSSVEKIEAALKPLIEAGFFIVEQDASSTLAPCKQDAMSESETDKTKRTEADAAALAFAEWQSGAEGHGWRNADFLTSTRRFRIESALKTYGGLEGWRRILDKAAEAGFFLDANDQWQPWFSLDWLVEGDHIARLLEGAYAERKKSPPKFESKFSKPDLQALPAGEPWEQRMRGWRERKQWLPQIWGPAPGEVGCRVPSHLIGGTA